jgi:FAD/FMN-containing dehydrogenase
MAGKFSRMVRQGKRALGAVAARRPTDVMGGSVPNPANTWVEQQFFRRYSAMAHSNTIAELLVTKEGKETQYLELPSVENPGKTIFIPVSADESDCDIKGYRYGHGKALAVAKPGDIEQLQAMLVYCNTYGIPVVPQGGNTGLVGGSNPDESGTMIVLNTNHFKKAETEEEGLKKYIKVNKEVDDGGNTFHTVTVAAGVTLMEVNNELKKQGLTLPIDIGSKESCNVTGVAATNAAGTRAGRYGNAKSQMVSYKVVRPNGNLEEIGVKYKKSLQDNSRIDFDNIDIGACGAFGVIYEATMKAVREPTISEAMLVVPRAVEDIPQIQRALQEALGDKFTAFESISNASMDLASRIFPKIQHPLKDMDKETREKFEKKGEAPIGLLIEASLTQTEYESEKGDAHEQLLEMLSGTIMKLYTDGLIVDVPMVPTDKLWDIRHHITDAINQHGKVMDEDGNIVNLVISNDISVESGKLGAFNKAVSQALEKKYGDKVEIYDFGHEWIGAVHKNLVWNPKCWQEYTDDIKQDIRGIVCTIATSEEFNGSISAEHGLGPHIAKQMQKWFETEAGKKYVEKVEALKEEHDPHGIMNPMLDGALGIEEFMAALRQSAEEQRQNELSAKSPGITR